MPRLELVEVDTEATRTPGSPLQHHQQSYDQNNTYYQQSSSTLASGDQSQTRSADNQHRTTSLPSPPQNSDDDDDDDTNPNLPIPSNPIQNPNDDQTQEAVVEEDERKDDDDETADEEEGGILFSCRCESARPVITLLSCLRNVSVSNNSGGGASTGGGVGRVPTSSDVTTSADSRRYGRGGKVQYAAVFVSDKSVVFQVHGVGRQSRATVEMQVGFAALNWFLVEVLTFAVYFDSVGLVSLVLTMTMMLTIYLIVYRFF